MVDFSEMPVQDGFRGCYDYENFDGTACSNLFDSSGLPLNVIDGFVQNNSLFLAQELGMAYLADDIGNNFTVYAIVKTDPSTSISSTGTTWGVAACGASSSYRVFAGQTKKNLWKFYASAAIAESISASEWHVIAFSANNGAQNMYIDGALAVSASKTIDFAISGLYLNTGGYDGAAPSVSEFSTNMYVKYIGYAVDNHSADQVLQNSKWLLEQYGFAEKSLDSQMAGADAAAIAWCIARTIERSSAFESIKKAYRKGLTDGDEGVTEQWEDDSDVIDIDADGTSITEPFAGSWSNGVKAETSDGGYVHIYVDNSYYNESVNATEHVWTYSYGALKYDIYYADGTVSSDHFIRTWRAERYYYEERISTEFVTGVSLVKGDNSLKVVYKYHHEGNEDTYGGMHDNKSYDSEGSHTIEGISVTTASNYL